MLHRIFNRNAHIWSVKLQVSCSHLNLQCIYSWHFKQNNLFIYYIYIYIFISISICCFALCICGQIFLHKSRGAKLRSHMSSSKHGSSAATKGSEAQKIKDRSSVMRWKVALPRRKKALIKMSCRLRINGWRVPRTKPYQTYPRIQTFRI